MILSYIYLYVLSEVMAELGFIQIESARIKQINGIDFVMTHTITHELPVIKFGSSLLHY